MAITVKGKSLIGLDIGSTSIKAIELAQTPEGLAIIGFAHSEITPQKDLKEALHEVINLGHFKTKRVATAISGRSVIVRYITMPEMTDEELKSAIKYEVGKYIPFEIEEVVIDCQALEEVKTGEETETKSASKEMRVLLAAVKREAIDEHVTLLEESGLGPTIIDVDSFALGNAFELYQTLGRVASQSPSESAEKITALIDLGASKTDVNIIQGSNSYFTREIYIAGNDFTDALTKKMGLDPTQAELLKREPGLKSEEVKEVISSLLDDLCHEIHLSLDYFEHQFDKPVDYLYISGGSSMLVGLEESFENAFEKRPIRWNPLEFLEVTSDEIDPAEVQSKSSQLAIALGLASRIM